MVNHEKTLAFGPARISSGSPSCGNVTGGFPSPERENGAVCDIAGDTAKGHEAGSAKAGGGDGKAAVRAELIAARARLTEGERASAARALRDTLLMTPEAEMAGTVAAYVSIGAEPGTHGLLFALWKRGTYVLVPKLLPGGDLDWASYEGPGSLRPGPYGLLEPSEPPRGPSAVRGADLIIVPALAVASSTGVRLGRGGGSYDRALGRVDPGILTIAAVYDDELVDTVPTEPHDRPVRAVVTPSRGLVRLADRA
jgi:5-formyltetrahydrofolate cyclo-ligase